MEKERMSRKKSIDVKNLPVAPEIPCEPKASPRKMENDPFSSLYSFKDRETAFFKSLNESIKTFDSENSLSCDAEMSADVNKKSCNDECRDYISPLMWRTQDSITALLATKDSLDQLDNLHRIVKQLLTVQEQNYQIRKRLKAVKTLNALKSMEIQVSCFITSFAFHLAAGDYSESTLISAKLKRRAKSRFIVNIFNLPWNILRGKKVLMSEMFRWNFLFNVSSWRRNTHDLIFRTLDKSFRCAITGVIWKFVTF